MNLKLYLIQSKSNIVSYNTILLERKESLSLFYWMNLIFLLLYLLHFNYSKRIIKKKMI